MDKSDKFSSEVIAEAFADFILECPGCGARSRIIDAHIDKNSQLHLTCAYCRLRLVISVNALMGWV